MPSTKPTANPELQTLYSALVCLFLLNLEAVLTTGYGRGKDSKDDILDSTDSALQDILEQLEDLKKKPKGVWMCKINSGSFKVPWSQTKKLIEALTFKGGLQIDVVDKK
jgi:hypothetical protein